MLHPDKTTASLDTIDPAAIEKRKVASPSDLGYNMVRTIMISADERRLLSVVLWDTDVAGIDKERDGYAIIERVMMYGGPEQVRWMVREYLPQEMAQVVRTSYNLDPKTAEYWAFYFHIPIEEVRCFSKPSPLR